MKKSLLVFLCLTICFLLCACGEVTPVETTAGTIATESTTQITTTEVIGEQAEISTPAEMQTITDKAYCIANLDWVRTVANSDEYTYEMPSVEIEYCLPSDWEENNGYYVSPGGDKIRLDTYAFFIGEASHISELPKPQILLNVLEPIETFEAENMLVYVCNNINIREHKYYILGYVRHTQYAFPFVVHSNSVEHSVFDIINQSISVKSFLNEQQYANNDSSYPTLKKVHINDLTCVYDKSLMGRVVDDLPKEWHIELDLPENWTFIPTIKSENNSSSSNTIYSEFGLPKCGLSPDKCNYQAFCGYNTYNAETAEFYDTEGITAGGNKYWIEKNERKDYHAIDANILVQLSDEYYYHFSLCVDEDNAELVQQVINSVALVCEPPSATENTLDKAKSLVEQIVTFTLTDDWLEESYTPTDLDIFRFLVSSCMYQDNDMHPYSNIVSVSDDGQSFQIHYSDAERMICEVFGEQKLMDSKYLSDIYDAKTESYFIPRGIGLWTSEYSFEITDAAIEDGNVCIGGILKNSNLYEYDEITFGEAKITFECLGDNDNSFLMYKSFNKLY